MQDDSALDHIGIFLANKLFHIPPEQQTQVVAPYTPLHGDHHEGKHS